MPATRTLIGVALASAALAACAGIACGYTVGLRSADPQRDVLVSTPPSGGRVAVVREGPCGQGRCQTLLLGSTRDDAVEVGRLTGRERCDEIAWSRDGYRMGFLVNGYELRVFDTEPLRPVAQLNLVQPDGVPSTRIARGVTFSDNGAAVTFDDCPRATSGCRSGLAGIR
ncbi:MAG TPA: hypothetical protein VM364_03220 [Vicinamibacterales bacterium]|nr:hypothetical protein [Vicinamibacterales bacterium]